LSINFDGLFIDQFVEWSAARRKLFHAGVLRALVTFAPTLRRVPVVASRWAKTRQDKETGDDRQG
jgi:hypothetical protein